jgi:hypothetical protein
MSLASATLWRGKLTEGRMRQHLTGFSGTDLTDLFDIHRHCQLFRGVRRREPTTTSMVPAVLRRASKKTCWSPPGGW